MYIIYSICFGENWAQPRLVSVLFLKCFKPWSPLTFQITAEFDADSWRSTLFVVDWCSQTLEALTSGTCRHPQLPTLQKHPPDFYVRGARKIKLEDKEIHFRKSWSKDITGSCIKLDIVVSVMRLDWGIAGRYSQWHVISNVFLHHKCTYLFIKRGAGGLWWQIKFTLSCIHHKVISTSDFATENCHHYGFSPHFSLGSMKIMLWRWKDWENPGCFVCIFTYVNVSTCKLAPSEVATFDPSESWIWTNGFVRYLLEFASLFL